MAQKLTVEEMAIARVKLAHGESSSPDFMDTQLGYHMVPLVFQRRHIIQCRMPPDPVIKYLYVFKDTLSCN